MTKAKKITCTAVFAAIATIMMYFEFPIPFMPPFLKVDLSGAVVLVGAFILGIAPAITMIGIKDLIHLTQTQTAGSGEAAVFQKQFPFNYTKSSKVEQKYSISPLKCLQSVILKSEVSIMQCKGSTKSTVSGRFKIIVAEISGVICGVKIQVAAAANMK